MIFQNGTTAILQPIYYKAQPLQVSGLDCNLVNLDYNDGVLVKQSGCISTSKIYTYHL